MTQKEYFQQLFNKLTLTYKGVHLNRVICDMLMWRAGNTGEFGNYRTLLRFFLSQDLSELKSRTPHGLMISFGYYPSRKDHRELMETVVERIRTDHSYYDMSKWSVRRLAISPKIFFMSLREGLYTMRGTGLTFKQKLFLSAQLCFFLNTIDQISKIDFTKVTGYLSLANSLELENLTTQYLNSIGKKTYSLMEGAYYLQKGDRPIDDIAFFNLTSNVQLCWGQYSKDEFMRYGYPESRMMVVGYPKKVIGKQMKEGNPFKKGVILLSQYTMEKQNLGLIESITPYNKDIIFYLKLHPSLDFDKYKKIADEKGLQIIPKEMTVNECVDNDKFDFAIAINSTAYYEALMRGLPCFRYFDGSYTPLAGCDDSFSDSESFIKQLNRIKNMPSSEFQKEVDNALEYAVGWGIDKYFEF